MTLSDVQTAFEERGIRKVKVGAFDIDGVLRGKYISPEKFLSAAQDGFGFCDVIFGWDSSDALYDDRSAFTGWHTGYPDALARIDLGTFRVVPWEPDTAFFIADLHHADGAPLLLSPRQLLQKVIGRAEGLGLRPFVAVEYEYFLFQETAHSVREKGYRGMKPLSPGMFGYSVLRASTHAEVVHRIIDEMRAYGVEIEGIHTETGPGVYETALRYDDALRAADKAALFKTGVKEIAARSGLIATFMAKWSADLPGCSGHVHQSLWDREGNQNLFHDERGDRRLSEVARHYIGGQVALMPEVMALVCPTVNSYKRTTPGTWAPTGVAWGVENRTTALRAIPGLSGKSTRVEYRLAGADANPYLAVAAGLASGLYGVERRVDPPPPFSGDAYAAPEGAVRPLPRSLEEATEALRSSRAARDLFGDAFVDHFAMTREWEARQFRKAVTDWELQRYFEVI